MMSILNVTIVLYYRFLYQVFPGTPKQCERLLRQAAKAGDLKTAEKLVQRDSCYFSPSLYLPTDPLLQCID